MSRAGEVLENAVSEQLARKPAIDIQSFIDESLGVNRKKKDFPRPPAKENYLIDVEAQRVRDALPVDVTRELQKRPAQEGGKVIDIEGEVVNPPQAIQLPDFLKSPSAGIDPRLPTIYREQFKGQELLRDTSKAVIDVNVQARLKDQGFTPEQITGMSPDTANTIYNNGVRVVDLELVPEKGR